MENLSQNTKNTKALHSKRRASGIPACFEIGKTLVYMRWERGKALVVDCTLGKLLAFILDPALRRAQLTC